MIQFDPQEDLFSIEMSIASTYLVQFIQLLALVFQMGSSNYKYIFEELLFQTPHMAKSIKTKGA